MADIDEAKARELAAMLELRGRGADEVTARNQAPGHAVVSEDS